MQGERLSGFDFTICLCFLFSWNLKKKKKRKFCFVLVVIICPCSVLVVWILGRWSWISKGHLHIEMHLHPMISFNDWWKFFFFLQKYHPHSRMSKFCRENQPPCTEFLNPGLCWCFLWNWGKIHTCMLDLSSLCCNPVCYKSIRATSQQLPFPFSLFRPSCQLQQLSLYALPGTVRLLLSRGMQWKSHRCQIPAVALAGGIQAVVAVPFSWLGFSESVL